MGNLRFAVFGVALTGVVVLAVSSVLAQDRRGGDTERPRPRVMVLDGRGAQIGVMVEDLEPAASAPTGQPVSGVRVTDVDADGPASRAGLRQGDIVTQVDGERVRSARQFARLIQESPDGRAVRLGILRDGQPQSIDVTPEARAFPFGIDPDPIGRDIARHLQDLEPRLRELEPRLRELEPKLRNELEPRLRELEPRLRELEPRLRELEPRLREFRFDGPYVDFDVLPRMTSPRSRLGVQVNELTPQLADYFGAADGGVLVAAVTPESPAARAGLQAGDVIISIDDQRVRHTPDLIDRLRDREGEVRVGILRDRRETTVTATLEAPRTSRPFRRPA